MKTKKKQTFEASLKKLEKIVDKIASFECFEVCSWLNYLQDFFVGYVTMARKSLNYYSAKKIIIEEITLKNNFKRVFNFFKKKRNVFFMIHTF